MTVENKIDKEIESKLQKELNSLTLPPKPVKTVSYDGHLVVSGLPIVKQDKIEKLKVFLSKNLETQGNKIENMQFVFNQSGETKGLMFVKFQTHNMAKEVMKNWNGRSIDKQHSYQMFLLEDYEKILSMTENYEEPAHREFRYKDNMLSWLLQPQCHDHILINCKSNHIQVFEHSTNSLIDIITREKFTESPVFWSSCGTFFASMHEKGIALWGGPNFDQITKYCHKKVNYVTFSPKENYLITYSPIELNYAVIVWNVIMEIEIREFIIPCDDPIKKTWPQIRWSFDDKYFARKQTDKISVYEAKTCSLLDKKSIEIPGVKDFRWSNCGHFISYWVPESSNNPARVVVMELPSKNEIFTKNLFNVSDINLHWSSQDEFLAVIGERYTKKKTTDDGPKYIGQYAILEIFRIQEKEIPVDKIDIKEKRQVVTFQWEPNGSRFGMITAGGSMSYLSIYDLKTVGLVQEIKSMEWSANVKMNTLKWSPKGQHLVCAAVKGGNIEFIDGTDGTVFHKVEHQNLHDLQWDPTGRYLVSSTLSLTLEAAECAINFWNLTGRLLLHRNFLGLKQVLWRPRPPCMLSEQKIKEIKKGMSKYTHRFTHEDELMSNETKRKQLENRRRLMSQWTELQNDLMNRFVKQKSQRMEQRQKIDTDNLELGHEKESIYILVSSKKEVL